MSSQRKSHLKTCQSKELSWRVFIGKQDDGKDSRCLMPVILQCLYLNRHILLKLVTGLLGDLTFGLQITEALYSL
ncbi:Uncharacterized protein TCM_038243 [Theobroma cacao]|uniref:Uncharacterized protein n=1 Tax=Theobroma cacao TaxID=3641 RepID=A0A061GPE9_THECC|nr:Uncharacterized protein TCM_038243 [Theobroma cacao]